MRIRTQKQLYFKQQSEEFKKSDILVGISDSLESLSNYGEILDEVLSDLGGVKTKSKSGRSGMSAEQVLRSLIVKTLEEYSYRDLEHASNDSISVRNFLKLNPFEKGFNFKTFQSNIKLLKEETIDLVNESIKSFLLSEKIDDGSSIRTDAFATESNIHYPTDSNLMNDSIRVLSRIMTYTYEDIGVPIVFQNHYKASKKKSFNINNNKSAKKRKKWNLELIRLTRKTLIYARSSLAIMENYNKCEDIKKYVVLQGLIADLKRYIPFVVKVIDQAHRRIVQGESVPADEKLFSIFEDHTDIISKGSRDIVFGHKNTITTGKSGLVLDVEIHEGNPADSTIVESVINRHKDFYKKAPENSVFDGCYSSTDNREFAAKEGIKNVCFSKETEEESSCSRLIRKMLRCFRAGIESTVSMLKRMFGLTRVMSKGFESFKVAVKSGVMTYNLFMLSRMRLKT